MVLNGWRPILRSRSFTHPIGPEGALGYRAEPDFLYLSIAAVNALGPHGFERSEDFHYNAHFFQKPPTHVMIFCETLVPLG